MVVIGTLFILTACQENQNSEIEKKGIEYYKNHEYEKSTTPRQNFFPQRNIL